MSYKISLTFFFFFNLFMLKIRNSGSKNWRSGTGDIKFREMNVQVFVKRRDPQSRIVTFRLDGIKKGKYSLKKNKLMKINKICISC